MEILYIDKRVGKELCPAHSGWGSTRSTKSPSSKARPLFTLYFHQTCLPLTKAMNHPPPTHTPTHPPTQPLFSCVGDRLISTVVEVREATESLT